MSLPPTYWLDQCRAELAAARARVCPCGVVPTQCLDHDPRRQKPEAEDPSDVTV